MRFVVAMDSFKGSLTSAEAGRAVSEGILSSLPDSKVEVYPVGDGGEGTAAALCLALGGNTCSQNVTGPLGEPVTSLYGVADRTVYLDIASVAGLGLVPKGKRDPMRTSTAGVGELIAACAASGYRDFVIGIGGSATCDGGMGMLSALGWAFFDENGEKPEPSGGSTLKIRRIVPENVPEWLQQCRFTVLCDVSVPLFGPGGSAEVFAPQKGADAQQVGLLDRGLKNLSDIADSVLQRNDPYGFGAGAAGGLGWAFSAFLGAENVSGTEYCLERTGVIRALETSCDAVFTGEGRLDGQSRMGKLVSGIVSAGIRKKVRPFILCGCLGDGYEKLGVTDVLACIREEKVREEDLEPQTAYRNLKNIACLAGMRIKEEMKVETL